MKNSSTCTKYFETFSQLQSSTSNATFMFHNGDGKSDENTKQQYYAYACMSAVPGIYHQHIRTDCNLLLVSDYPKPS